MRLKKLSNTPQQRNLRGILQFKVINAFGFVCSRKSCIPADNRGITTFPLPFCKEKGSRVRQEKVVVVGAGGPSMGNAALLREIRGSFFSVTDVRFLLIAFFSVLVHVMLAYVLRVTEVSEQEVIVLEKIPERFAKLIVEKPLPKEETKKKLKEEIGQSKEAAEEKPAEQEADSPKKKEIRKEKAKQAVAQRAARVEQKVRTVGVLGMLTGVGATALAVSFPGADTD